MSRFCVSVLVILSGSLTLAADLNSVSSHAVSNQGFVKHNSTKDGLTKRGVVVEDDPPPEYYRGPASSHGSTYNSGDRDNTLAGYPSRPVAFPSDGKYGYKGGSWSNTNAGQQERKGLSDRVSVGHYNSGISHSSYGGGNHGFGSSTTAHPYGPAQPVEYEYYVPTGNGHGYSEGGEGIPVEFYNRGYSSGYGGHGNYGGHGGGGGDEYSTYTVTTGHDSGGHAGGKHGYDKALLAKSFLIPLASAAVLGIAAALASNPLLLQLGTVSSIGKRKRRDADDAKIVHSMAYRRQRRN